MALFPRPILTNGATHSAQQFRMLVRDLSNGSEGVTQGDDLKVTQRATPGGGVLVGDGSAVVRGRANVFQGSYSACNIGAVDVPIAATGAGGGRSDMVVLRIEDPEYEGSINPATGEVAYFQVISNVSSSATTIPDSRTAIPLARIDIPASTSTITNAMITDLRKVANPRRSRYVATQSPASLSTAIGASTSYSYFSTAAGWSVSIPDWATKAIVKVDVSPIRYDTGPFWGYLSATFGSSLTVQPTTLDDNQSGVRRIAGIIADTLTIPASYRGTSQLLRVRAAAAATGQTGRIYIDTGTTLAVDVQFEEAPR
ncbi:hypothetical protein [Streptomyces glaucescens]|uniref:hypothetical protein n=1 Tax=Streptomyces glaucescens TaxID=1907 RepID=UPI000A3C4A23|nr:hypothetical protein [Streptomyces glaucescens]